MVADGRAELAVSRLRRLLQDEPHQGEAQALLGATLLSLHQPEEALRAADAAIAHQSDHAEGHHLRARVLLQLGQPAPALASARAATAREPLVPSYQKALVRAALAAGSLEDAAAGAAALSRLEPGEADGRLAEAEVSRRQGHLDRAGQLADSLCSSHPDHPGVRRLVHAVEADRAAAPPAHQPDRRRPPGRWWDRLRRR